MTNRVLYGIIRYTQLRVVTTTSLIKKENKIMTFTRNEIRSIKAYEAQGFTHAEALKMRICDVLSNLLFCEMTEEERYSEENATLLERYESLVKELGI